MRPTSPAAPDIDRRAGWPSRDQLLARQRQLLLRSAELRGELSAELRAGWRSVEAPLDLALRVRQVVIDLRRWGGELRDRHPWLSLTTPLWPMLARRLWRLVRRRSPGRADAAADRPGHLLRLLQLLQWARRAIHLWRLFVPAAPTGRPPA